MIPSKFRHNNGTKAKTPQGSSKFPAGFKPTISAPVPGSMLGSMPGSMPGSMSSTMAQSTFNTGQRQPPSPQKVTTKPAGAYRPPPQTPHPSQPLPKHMIPPVKSMLAPDPRRVLVDHIIRDCYSKSIVVDGKKVPEIKYNTHLLIREYSSYPQSAPPSDLSPAQIGSVKSRILVVCTKHTGRVLLQKGKYNDQKKVYQIGRTWDLDELTCVSRVGNDSFVLSLNKDYYWKSGDDPGRLLKFVHHLAVIHQRFTGHYPQMKGFTLEALGLDPALSAPQPPATREGTAISGGAPKDIARETQKEAPRPVHPPDHYSSMDFTVNGKLPMKPMQVMDVDRPAPSMSSTTLGESVYTQETAPNQDTRHPDTTPLVSQVSSARQSADSPSKYADAQSHAPSETSANDSQSFVFTGDDTMEMGHSTHTTMPTISEYARKNGSSSPLRNYNPEREMAQRGVSDNLETAASYGLQLVDQMDNTDAESTKFQFEVPESGGLGSKERDDSIEEASLTGSSIETQVYVSKKNKELNKEVNEENKEANNEPGNDSLAFVSRKDSVIDDSIREIEDFMVSQFGKEPTENKVSHTRDASRTSEFSYGQGISHSRSPSKSLARKLSEPFPLKNIGDERQGIDEERGLSEKDPQIARKEPEAEVKFEKDPEIEELLDEIGWNPTDGSDSCVKMLRKELTSIKHKNVSELTTLDFGKDTLANEVKISSAEVDNLVEIFKKMEVSFQVIAPQICSIENNSKGLQVEAVNKKILYNELNEIMHKVRLSERDLKTVANYQEFDDISMVPILEGKLLMLYDALGAIGNKTSDDDLSQMQALKQFHETYENVSLSFAHRYSIFISTEFKRVIEDLNRDVSNVFPHNILPNFRKQYAFAGVNKFVKYISERDFMSISDKFNAYAANLLDNVLSSRAKAIYSTTNSARNSRLAYNSEPLSGLKKNKSSRFGSTRILGRISGVNGDQASKAKTIEVNSKGIDEISDARVIIRLVKESKELMLAIQFFLGSFFHLTSADDFSTYLTDSSFEQRIANYDNEDVDSVNYKMNSNELLRNMTAIFGNYINKFTREITPTDLITTQVLVGLFELLADAAGKDQDFVAYSFIGKLAEKYRSNWDRFIAHQVDLFNKADVRAKGGVLPVVRNLNQIITMVETSLQESQNSRSDLTEVNSLITQTYGSLTKAATNLFHRNDPLLKSNTHDEKERAYRNVAVLQNLYSILQQLSEYDSTTTASMQTQLGDIFKVVQQEYLDYIVRMHVGKMSEFVHGHSDGDQKNRSKKEDKILVRGISSSHTAREMSTKISEMLRKMEKHVISSDTVFEHDLLDLLWRNLEEVVEGLFRDFHRIARSVDRDIEESVSAGEIRRLFSQEHSFKQ